MSMCVVIGIDIGLTGCCARLGPGMAPELADLPTVPDGPPRSPTPVRLTRKETRERSETAIDHAP